MDPLTPMDHAEAHELVADLTLEPGRLSALGGSDSPTDRALLEHAAGCPACAAEIASWQGVHTAVSNALGGSAAADVVRISAPADLRRKVLTAVHQPDRPVAFAQRPSRWLRFTPRFGIALAALTMVALMAGGVAVMRDQSVQLDAASARARSLATALATANRVLADPARHIATLNQPSGTATGSVAWSSHDLVVLASGLTEPVSGQTYRCWVLGDTGETAIGQMDFVNGQAFWVGSLDNWAAVNFGPGYRFIVTLEATGAPSTAHSGPIVLEGVLGA